MTLDCFGSRRALVQFFYPEFLLIRATVPRLLHYREFKQGRLLL